VDGKMNIDTSRFSAVTRYPAHYWSGDAAREDYAKKHGIPLDAVCWQYDRGAHHVWHEIKDRSDANPDASAS